MGPHEEYELFFTKFPLVSSQICSTLSVQSFGSNLWVDRTDIKDFALNIDDPERGKKTVKDISKSLLDLKIIDCSLAKIYHGLNEQRGLLKVRRIYFTNGST